MKAVCIKTYYDKELHRTIAKGEEIELSQERFKQLSTNANESKEVLVSDATEKEAPKKKG